MDVGTDFPWDVFMDMVGGFLAGGQGRADDEMGLFLLQGDDNQGYQGAPILYLCTGLERYPLTGAHNGSLNSYGGFKPYTNAGMLTIKTNQDEAQAAGRTMEEQLTALGGELVPPGKFTKPSDILKAIQDITVAAGLVPHTHGGVSVSVSGSGSGSTGPAVPTS
jgi:hypothetical protein